MNTFKMISDIIGSIGLIVSLFILLRIIHRQQKQILHLYILTGALARGISSPIVRGVYQEILNKGCEKPITKADGYKYYHDHWEKQYQTTRMNVEQRISETEDPVEKNHLEKALQALDDSHNLLSTLSPDSSEEYAAQVFANVATVMSKLDEEE